MPTILLKKSDTPGSVPGTANLTNLAGGVEVAVNTADKRVYSMTSASAVIELGTNPSSLTCSDGSFVLLKAASASITNLTATSLVLSNLSIASANITTLTSASATITNLLATTLTVSGGTANGVLYLNGSKVATSGSGFTYDGTSALISGGNLRVDRATNTTTVTLGGSPSANWEGDLIFATSNTQINWRIASNRVSGGALTFTPSTAAGGSTFTTPAMTIDNASNVGIGTASPGAKLSVNGAATVGTATQASNAALTLQESASNSTAIVMTNRNSTQSWGITVDAAAVDDKILAFIERTGSNVRMALTDTGNLGIGTASPTNYGATYKTLAVNGSSTGIVDVMQNGTVYGQLSTEANVYKVEAVGASTVLRLVTNSTTRATLDSSGNLGLGVTPTNNTLGKTLQVGQAGAWVAESGSNRWWLASNWYYNSGDKYINNGFATLYSQQSGQHQWLTAASGTINTAISFTQAMTLDASGNLGVGTTTPASGFRLDLQDTTARLRLQSTTGTNACHIQNNNTGGQLLLGIDNSAGSSLFGVAAYAAGLWYTGNYPLVFGTNNTERGRFTAGGYFKASNNGTYNSSTSSQHEFYQTDNSNALRVTSTSSAVSGAYGLYVDLTADPNATDSFFIRCYGGANQRASIRSNGGLANYQANNVDLSDARTKNSITPAASMWDKVAALEIVTYKYNDQTHDDVNLGVIAQQVESVEPVWVDADGFGETPEGEEPLKTVYTKDITFAAIKALQEAMARIESLEAKVAALEAQ